MRSTRAARRWPSQPNQPPPTAPGGVVPATSGTAASVAKGSSPSPATRSGSEPTMAPPPGASGGRAQPPVRANGSGSLSARMRTTSAGESRQSRGTRISVAVSDDGEGDDKVGLTGTLLILNELVQ